jgi:hypothetical protein
VQPERLLERGRELVERAGHVERNLAQASQLPAPAAVEVAALRGCPGAVHRVPAHIEVEHRRLGAWDQLQPVVACGRGEPARLRQPEDVREVGAGAGRPLDEPARGRRVGPVRHEDIRERGGVLADEARDAESQAVLDEQRQRAR